MKNLLKGVILIVLMLVMVIALTGCGGSDEEDEVEEGEKVEEVVRLILVAEKTSTEDGVEMKEKHAFVFVDNRLSTVQMTYEFSDEAAAIMMGGYMKLSLENTVIEGNKVTINLSAEEYQAEVENSQQQNTIEEMKASLESKGYTISTI